MVIIQISSVCTVQVNNVCEVVLNEFCLKSRSHESKNANEYAT